MQSTPNKFVIWLAPALVLVLHACGGDGAAGDTGGSSGAASTSSGSAASADSRSETSSPATTSTTTSVTSTDGTTGDADGLAEDFPACANYLKTVARADLELCADEFMPVCEALATQEECDGFPQLDGTFDPAGVLIMCAWTEFHFVGTAEGVVCDGTVSPRCLAGRWPGPGGPSCGESWENYRELDGGQLALAEVPCGILPLRYESCFMADPLEACDCPFP